MQEDLANRPVRIHKSLVLRHPAARLWYLCRALDPQGRGRVEIDPETLASLSVSKSTIYRWLKEGHELGFFRIYEFRPDGTLYVSLGGLTKVCRQSGIRDWGVVSVVPLRQVLEGFLRALASAIQTQDLQEKSHYAAANSLSATERRQKIVPKPAQVLGNLTSPQMNCGVIPGLLKRGADKIFVGRSFIPHGASQQGICAELNAEPTSCGICSRTLRNHLKRLGVERRQLVQTKPEYRTISLAIQHGAVNDGIRLFETNGSSSAKRRGGHILKPQRFFQYQDLYWIYRPNLYALDYVLTSMKRSRAEYKKTRRRSQFVDGQTAQAAPIRVKRLTKRKSNPQPVENLGGAGAVENPPHPPIEDRAISLALGGGEIADTKEEKNKNACVEPVTASEEVDWHTKCLEQIADLKARLLEQRWRRLTSRNCRE